MDFSTGHLRPIYVQWLSLSHEADNAARQCSSDFEKRLLSSTALHYAVAAYDLQNICKIPSLKEEMAIALYRNFLNRAESAKQRILSAKNDDVRRGWQTRFNDYTSIAVCLAQELKRWKVLS
ncbi:hypothetical protein J9A50_22925 [Klebsiella pneumoniae]|nr:hypothetical protein [Klebsiella pneumoniae]HBR5503487.1 hypothetical protein [Klebsiella pneumoniae]HBR6758290.1 hypothetical protein [Klebsiella pneumoniae]HBT0597764.1 hypothetical protein [Klebsiella pneumoniae]HDG7582584.1 hypothetical protein [Klebsiella pneumoniae]